MLTVIDEYSRGCLTILVARRLKSDDVLHLLAELFAARGMPDHIRSDDGPNGRLRDELLNGEIFYSLEEVKVLIDAWRRHYNTIRPHSALGCRPPAPETILHHRPVPAFAHPGLRPTRASGQACLA